MATINVKDAAGSTVALEKPLTPGQAAMAVSRPVVIASDQSTVPVSLASVPSHAVTNAGTFAVQAASTLTAETTKVIGVVRAADGSGNLLTSTGNAIDVNIKTGVNANGQATMANSAPVAIASNQASIPVAATLTAETTKVIGTVNVAAAQTIGVTNTPLTNFGAGEYETVAAGVTAQVLGPTGATGDYISGLLVIPATTTPGLVTLLDNATSIPVFVGGASSVSNLVPFFIPLGMISVSGAWKVTTGNNVSVIGIGNFT